MVGEERALALWRIAAAGDWSVEAAYEGKCPMCLVARKRLIGSSPKRGAGLRLLEGRPDFPAAAAGGADGAGALVEQSGRVSLMHGSLVTCRRIAVGCYSHSCQLVTEVHDPDVQQPELVPRFSRIEDPHVLLPEIPQDEVQLLPPDPELPSFLSPRPKADLHRSIDHISGAFVFALFPVKRKLICRLDGSEGVFVARHPCSDPFVEEQQPAGVG